MLVFVGNHRWFEEKQWPEEFLAIQDTQECPLRAPVDACINITDGNIQPMSIGTIFIYHDYKLVKWHRGVNLKKHNSGLE